ncbi:Pv-fam-d protein, partial [Plasmodium cynomolgi strain B]
SNVHSKAWDRRIIKNRILDIRTSRLFKQKIDTQFSQSYSDVKERISETFEENDYRFAQGLNELEPEQNFGKNCDTLMREGSFEKSCDEFNYDDNLKKTTSHFKFSEITYGDDFCDQLGPLNNDDYFNISTRLLKFNGSYEELFDVEEYATVCKIENKRKKRRHPKRIKYKCKVREQEDFWIFQFLKEVDLNFELDMLRFLKGNSSVNYYAVKHKSKFRKLLYFINRYKVFVPLLINFVIAVMLIVASAGTPGVR